MKKKRLSEKIFDVFNVTLLTLFMLACIYPFYYVLIYSLSDPKTVQKGVYLLPVDFTLFNFTRIFSINIIYTGMIISVLRTVIGAIITVFCCMYFAYLLMNDDMPLKKFFYRYTVITMYISSGLIPYYLTIRAYGLRNTFLVYVIPTAVSAFNVILFKTFMEQIPPAMEESARIDGAGIFKVFWKIIFPLSTPIVASVVVFASVAQWNSWFDTYIFVTNKNLFTLQYILLNFLRESEALAQAMRTSGSTASAPVQTLTSESVKMTITVVVLIPILLVYPFMQRYFIKGIMLGAVKG